ncbi:YggN family protein [Vibrio tarriae]|uniref:YggN family protein n=1 Tax=Vibrio tarriae TaxID=2014742 RepID=UPI000DE4AC4A|nr:YggN family protein [Vibrio tarriae]RBM40035.1 chemotaxis protein [Vibrio tarriae]
MAKNQPENTMKKTFLTLAVLMSSSTWAAQCQVDIQNEVHLNTQRIEILRTSSDKALIDKQNNLYIQGKRVSLSADQQAAVRQYREQLTSLLPKAQRWADDSLKLANQLVDDVALSLEAPQAFNNVKTSIATLFAEAKAEYFKNGDLVVPAEKFAAMQARWQQKLAQGKEVLTQQFFTSAFDVMASKMQQEGGVNLSQLGKNMADLKNKLDSKLKEQSSTFEKQGREWCDSLNKMTQQEQQLHKKIPQLKNYQVFTI